MVETTQHNESYNNNKSLLLVNIGISIKYKS